MTRLEKELTYLGCDPHRSMDGLYLSLMAKMGYIRVSHSATPEEQKRGLVLEGKFERMMKCGETSLLVELQARGLIRRILRRLRE